MNFRNYMSLVAGFVLVLTAVAVKGNAQDFRTARALGMAGAYVAVADDSGSSFYNPAGLLYNKTREVSITGQLNSQDQRYYLASYIDPSEEKGTPSCLSFAKRTDQSNDRTDNLIVYGMAQTYGANYSVGVNFKYRQATLGTATDSAVGFDLGVMTDATQQIRIGAAVFNVSEPSLSGIPDGQQTRTIVVGGSYRPDPITILALDIYDFTNRAGSSQYRLGVERKLTEGFTARAGYQQHGDFALGFGAKLTKFRVDYGYQRGGDAGVDMHLLSITAPL